MLVICSEVVKNMDLLFRRGGGWKYALGNYQLRWKLKPREEMRSLREDEKGTENGTFYIITLLSK